MNLFKFLFGKKITKKQDEMHLPEIVQTNNFPKKTWKKIDTESSSDKNIAYRDNSTPFFGIDWGVNTAEESPNTSHPEPTGFHGGFGGGDYSGGGSSGSWDNDSSSSSYESQSDMGSNNDY